ncbi:MAG: hypothetical protein WED10_06390 [Brumimicrobium sp.]
MMNAQLLIGYKDIYGEPSVPLSHFAAKINLNWAGQFISNVNGAIFFSESNSQVQELYLNYLIKHWDKSEKVQFYSKVLKKRGYELQIDDLFYFSRHGLLYLFFEILKLSRNFSTDYRAPSDSDKDNLIKAILIANDQVNERVYDEGIDFSKQTDLRNFKWATFNLQNQLGHFDPIIKMIKAKCFFDFLENNAKLSHTVSDYLKYYESENSWTLLLKKRLTPFIRATSKYRESGAHTHQLAFIMNDTDKTMIDNLTLKLDNSFPKTFSLRLFKSQPLLKISSTHFTILDWGLYLEHLFEAIVFDFFESTNIRELGPYKNFISFKNNLIDTHFYEGYLLSKIMDFVFPKKFQIKLSENEIINSLKTEKSVPDFYIRDGKNIYLIEFKNCLYPSDIDDTSDSEKIKKMIDKKLNTSNVGVGQQIKRIKYLKGNSYENSSESSYPKNRNISIYPIIIFTDVNFNIPGIGRYLNESFEKQVDSDLRICFKNIYPLVFIHIDYFIEYVDLFSKDNQLFKTHLDRFIKYQIQNDKKGRSKSGKKFMYNEKSEMPFTHVTRNLFNYEYQRKGFVQSAFDSFDLLQNMD